jgi:chorismate synthase
MSGGGHFSARLTLPLCFAGAVCLQILNRKDIFIDAHVYSIGDVCDDSYTSRGMDVSEGIEPEESGFPTLSRQSGEGMIAAITEAREQGDSLGGIVEGGVWGLPAGLGEPIFDNIESRLAYALFAIPAVKGVEFGAGFSASAMRGSECNDPFYMDGATVRTVTNHSGGIQGGITNGMPVIFRAGFKPTPSISIPQRSVNLQTGEDTTLHISGRHDPCVVPRAVPCVIAAAAVTVLDIVLGG